MDNLGIQLSFRHEASRAKWRKEIFRPEPPPFLGPLITIQEAAQALNRSKSYVRNRIDDGRLNCWKDPANKRVWILKHDIDLLLKDNSVLEEKNGRHRGGKRGARKPKPQESNPESESNDKSEEEDLDAIGGWEAPKPPPVPSTGDLVAQWQQESEDRYEQKQRETEEWYAAELAKLEHREPEEAVRQLQIERGWLTPEPTTVNAPDSPSLRRRGPGGGSSAQPATVTVPDSPFSPCEGEKGVGGMRGAVRRPISRSNPNHVQPPPVEPYVDPDLITPSPPHPIIPPFPVGWVIRRTAAKAMQVTPCHLDRLARNGILTRRKCPKTGRWLYDSLELEHCAEQQLDKQMRVSRPGKRIDWWGSRAAKIDINEFDSWITVQEAARLLGVQRARICAMCDKGLLPARQDEPGKRGSKITVPHNAVRRLAQRPDHIARRKRWQESRARPSADIEHEDWNIEPHSPREESKATRKTHGDYLTTKQAALALGVSTPTVRNLMLRGRLQGVHLRPKKPGSAKNPYWFFKRADVDALLADPAYLRNSKRGKQAHWLSPNDQ